MNGGVLEDVISRVNERAKVSGAMKKVRKAGSLGVDAKRIMYDSVMVATVLCGAETWGLNAWE